MFKCNECGAEFDNLDIWEEDRGEFWGQRCSERMCGCPECHSRDYEEYDEDDSDEYEFDPRDADCESQ